MTTHGRQAKNSPALRCDTCGQALGAVHVDRCGGPPRCLDCLTTQRIDVMLTVLPHEGEGTWDDLRPFEQTLLTAIREQVARKKALSDKQVQALERIYDQHT